MLRWGISDRRRTKRAAGVCLEVLESRTLLAAATFANPVASSISARGPASAVAVGDVNGDGVPDVVASAGAATAALTGFTASVFTGSNTGSFKPVSTVATARQMIALADFNGDGKLDLATAAGVLPGKGDGTFGTPVAGFSLPANTVSFLAADFNGDGKQDLAAVTFTLSGTTHQPTVGLSVLLGNGDGTFKSAVNTTIASGASVTQNDAIVVTGDFNGDGKLDVATPFGVLLGKGDGTFSGPTALPVSALPTVPALVAADFNGDKKLDLVVVPTTATAGQAELLLGNGDGSFKDSGPITIASSGSISALATADVNSDGSPDLIAGVAPASGGKPSVVVLTNNGTGTLGSPASFTVDGVPLAIFTGDFNADKKPDILSIDGINGSAGGTTNFAAGTADVLLNTTPATSTGGGTGSGGSTTPSAGPATGTNPSTVTVSSSANPILVGQRVTFTITFTVQLGLPKPTGTVTLLDFKKKIGIVSVSASGTATFTTSSLPLGARLIQALYSGDSTYKLSYGSFFERVLLSKASSPLLVPAISSVRLPSSFVAGTPGIVSLSIVNGGGGQAFGQVLVSLFASRNGKIDAASIPIQVLSNSTPRINLGRGKASRVLLKFVAGDYRPGTYSILARLTPLTHFTEAQLEPIVARSPTTFQAAGHVFGTVGGRRGLPVTVIDSQGRSAVLSLTGPGSGTFTQTAGAIDLTLTGTTAASRLRITRTGTPLQLGSVTVNGSLGLIDAPDVAFAGALTISGAGKLQSVTVGSITGGTWAVPGAIGSLVALGSVSNTRIVAGAIHAITVRGTVSADSRFLAASLPGVANLDGVKVATATDPRFR